MGKPTKEGYSPVHENKTTSFRYLSTAGNAPPVGIWEDHFPKLNTLEDR